MEPDAWFSGITFLYSADGRSGFIWFFEITFGLLKVRLGDVMTEANISIHAGSYQDQTIEIVERKGLGHPDTICDALAEDLSRALCQFYLQKFDLILHHNVDKVLLRGGVSVPRFSGGNLIEKIDIYMAGRATGEYKGIKVPINEIIQNTCEDWFINNLHALEFSKHVTVHNLVRHGSGDLIDLYLRQHKRGIALANDTSCGVGYAPLSELERVVKQVENQLNTPEFKARYPETGEDIKVMGVKHNRVLDITVACAFIDHYISDINDYIDKKNNLSIQVGEIVRQVTDMSFKVHINNADDIDSQSVYITVTGTSAESGDDGEVGRGNRVNGLITPYRHMNMEAAAGKNPVTHVGKIYNIVAQNISAIIVDEIPEVKAAYCFLASQIGSPVNLPHVIDLKLELTDNRLTIYGRNRINKIIEYQLSCISDFRDQIVSRGLAIY